MVIDSKTCEFNHSDRATFRQGSISDTSIHKRVKTNIPTGHHFRHHYSQTCIKPYTFNTFSLDTQ